MILYVKIKEYSCNANSKTGINKIYEKVKSYIKRIFCVIELEEILNGYIAKIPINKIELNKSIKKKNSFIKRLEYRFKNMLINKQNNIIAKKLRRIIKEKNINGIVLDEKIKEDKDFINKLTLKKSKNAENILYKSQNLSKNIRLFNGESLFKYIIYDIFVYIMNIQKRKMELEDVYIIANEIDDNTLNNIEFLSTKFKNVNIVTKNIEKYRYVEDYIYNNTGNTIVLLNNKKKSLKRAKYIINVDNKVEQLKEYSIYRKAIIINMQDIFAKNIVENTSSNLIEKKNNADKKAKTASLQGFEGILVNSFDIDLNEKAKEFFKKYKLINLTNLSILYESFLNQKENFKDIRAKIEDAGLIVIKLYGNNGIIDENEYKRVNISDNEAKKCY